MQNVLICGIMLYMKRYILPVILLLASIGIGFTLLFHTNATKPVNSVDNRPVATTATHPPTREELLALTNKARAENGLPPVTEDPRLDTSAQRKADDEVKYGYIGHVSPNDGKHGYTYIYDVWSDCPKAGENLTENTSVNDSQHAFNAWMNSTPHRNALLNPHNLAIGFGISNNEVVAHSCTSQ